MINMNACPGVMDVILNLFENLFIFNISLFIRCLVPLRYLLYSSLYFFFASRYSRDDNSGVGLVGRSLSPI